MLPRITKVEVVAPTPPGVSPIFHPGLLVEVGYSNHCRIPTISPGSR
jgi:hypothetical protein